MNLDLSIVIPCHGRIDLTELTLRSLCACPDQFEVVIVDDASPESLEPLATRFADELDLRCARNPVNVGPAATRNRGVSLASHDVIAFTDNDCVVEPTWPRRLYEYLRDAPRGVAGVGGRVLAATSDVFSRYYTFHKILDPFLHEGRYLYLVTANCAFRREALEAVGGFDEVIAVPGGEDPGLCFKLLEKGYSVHYREDAIVHHHYRTGARDFARTFFRYGRGCRVEADRHAGALAHPLIKSQTFGGM